MFFFICNFYFHWMRRNEKWTKQTASTRQRGCSSSLVRWRCSTRPDHSISVRYHSKGSSIYTFFYYFIFHVRSPYTRTSYSVVRSVYRRHRMCRVQWKKHGLCAIRYLCSVYFIYIYVCCMYRGVLCTCGSPPILLANVPLFA